MSEKDISALNANLFKSLSVQETSFPGLIHVTVPRRNPSNGELQTQEFYEKPHHGGSIDFFDPIPWKEDIPAGASVLGASAGQINDMTRIYWVAWLHRDTLSALSIALENPISVPLPPTDHLIHPPIQNLDKKFRIYFWRKQDGKNTLLCHVFSGEGKQPGSFTTEKILDIPYDPLFTVADPIPSVFDIKGVQDNGKSVIGWLSFNGAELRAHAVWMDGNGAHAFDSDPIAGYQPFPTQRIGIYGGPEGKIHLAWVMGRIDSGTNRAAEWLVDVKTSEPNLKIREQGFEGSKIQSVASIVPRSSEPQDTFYFALTKNGSLFRRSADGWVREERTGLPMTYDFPIVTSFQGSYEAMYNAKGMLVFERL